MAVLGSKMLCRAEAATNNCYLGKAPRLSIFYNDLNSVSNPGRMLCNAHLHAAHGSGLRKEPICVYSLYSLFLSYLGRLHQPKLARVQG